VCCRFITAAGFAGIVLSDALQVCVSLCKSCNWYILLRNFGTESTLVDGDFILSTVVSPAILEVFCVAAI